MAWLQRNSTGKIHIAFRFGGRVFKRSLHTRSEREAQTRLERLEENIRLVESGRMDLDPAADIPTFLLSDGKLPKKC